MPLFNFPQREESRDNLISLTVSIHKEAKQEWLIHMSLKLPAISVPQQSKLS